MSLFGLNLSLPIIAGRALATPISKNLPPVRLADGMLFEQGEKRRLLSKEGVEKLEGALLQFDGTTDCPFDLKHLFAPGVYIREITMPRGDFIIGAEHTTEHFNIVLQGRASVIMEGEVHEIEAPATFVSRAGVRKVLQIHETCIWQTVHPNPDNLRDIVELERRLCTMSATHQEHFEGLKPAPASSLE